MSIVRDPTITFIMTKESHVTWRSLLQMAQIQIKYTWISGAWKKNQLCFILDAPGINYLQQEGHFFFSGGPLTAPFPLSVIL